MLFSGAKGPKLFDEKSVVTSHAQAGGGPKRILRVGGLQVLCRKESFGEPPAYRVAGHRLKFNARPLERFSLLTVNPSGDPGNPPLRASQRCLMGLHKPPHLPAFFSSSAFFASIAFCSSIVRFFPAAISSRDICFSRMAQLLRPLSEVIPARFQ